MSVGIGRSWNMFKILKSYDQQRTNDTWKCSNRKTNEIMTYYVQYTYIWARAFWEKRYLLGNVYKLLQKFLNSVQMVTGKSFVPFDTI